MGICNGHCLPIFYKTGGKKSSPQTENLSRIARIAIAVAWRSTGFILDIQHSIMYNIYIFPFEGSSLCLEKYSYIFCAGYLVL